MKADDKIKEFVNQRHVQVYNKLLDNIEFLLDKFSISIDKLEIEYTDIPKTTLATLDFLISSITKIQKGHRTALGFDSEVDEVSEPPLSIIKGADFDKI